MFSNHKANCVNAYLGNANSSLLLAPRLNARGCLGRLDKAANPALHHPIGHMLKEFANRSHLTTGCDKLMRLLRVLHNLMGLFPKLTLTDCKFTFSLDSILRGIGTGMDGQLGKDLGNCTANIGSGKMESLDAKGAESVQIVLLE
jgi:hypothetical protein